MRSQNHFPEETSILWIFFKPICRARSSTPWRCCKCSDALLVYIGTYQC
jgi:hypothetical protein